VLLAAERRLRRWLGQVSRDLAPHAERLEVLRQLRGGDELVRLAAVVPVLRLVLARGHLRGFQGFRV
jgi:hypothetical protein